MDETLMNDAISFELEKHPWLSKGQARKIVEDNLEDDPGFYEGLTLEEDGQGQTDLEEPCHGEPSKKSLDRNGPSLTIVVGG